MRPWNKGMTIPMYSRKQYFKLKAKLGDAQMLNMLAITPNPSGLPQRVPKKRGKK